MSKRRKPAARRPAAKAPAATPAKAHAKAPPRATSAASNAPAAARSPRSAGRPVDLAIMVAAFALCSALAGAAGATNLGTALSFGQIGFALTATYVLLRR